MSRASACRTCKAHAADSSWHPGSCANVGGRVHNACGPRGDAGGTHPRGIFSFWHARQQARHARQQAQHGPRTTCTTTRRGGIATNVNNAPAHKCARFLACHACTQHARPSSRLQHMHACTHTHVFDTCARTYMHVHTHMYPHTHTHICTRVHVRTYTDSRAPPRATYQPCRPATHTAPHGHASSLEGHAA